MDTDEAPVVGDFASYWDSEQELSYLCRIVEDYGDQYKVIEVIRYGRLQRIEAWPDEVFEKYLPTEKELQEWTLAVLQS